jgi:phosphatidylglycerol:prolipoprotein diacylglycerol transferase
MGNFIDWWQHIPERLDPVFFTLGPLRLHYYGLMYLIAFALTYGLVSRRIRHEKGFSITADQAKDMLLVMVVGLLIGARLGYALFYNFSYYLENPLEVFLPFRFENGITFTGFSGMSYHGGLIGVAAATVFYVRRKGISLFEAVDLFAPAIPLGYTFGRLGNFINGELYGRPTIHAIGMRFPQAPGPGLRHPSQLYEAFFEGIFLFLVLWWLKGKKAPSGAMLALYLAGYGTVRFFIEFFREPDAHLGFVWLSLSMGQVLCLGMIGAGAIFFIYSSVEHKRL